MYLCKGEIGRERQAGLSVGTRMRRQQAGLLPSPRTYHLKTYFADAEGNADLRCWLRSNPVVQDLVGLALGLDADL